MTAFTPPPRHHQSTVLVLGGARSGKSQLAEGLAAAWSRVAYIAPGPIPDPNNPADAEWCARVDAHQQRRPANWHTIETADVPGMLASLNHPIADAHTDLPEAVLVDCLGTWVTRLIDDARAWQDRQQAEWVVNHATQRLLATLRSSPQSQRSPAAIILVSNETGLGVVPEHHSGRLFRDLLGHVNEAVASACERVLLVVAGRVIDIGAAPTIEEATALIVDHGLGQAVLPSARPTPAADPGGHSGRQGAPKGPTDAS